MFEVGFGEILMLGLVALLVLGPEQLPKVARTAGLWFGRARRMIVSVKADIERELRAEEIRDIMRQQALSSSLEEIIEETKVAVNYSHLNDEHLGYSHNITEVATATVADDLITKNPQSSTNSL